MINGLLLTVLLTLQKIHYSLVRRYNWLFVKHKPGRCNRM